MKVIICAGCGTETEHKAHGLCEACYRREWRAENPDKRAAQRRRWKRRRRLRKRGYLALPGMERTLGTWGKCWVCDGSMFTVMICQGCGGETTHRLYEGGATVELWLCEACECQTTGPSLAELHARGYEWQKLSRDAWILARDPRSRRSAGS